MDGGCRSPCRCGCAAPSVPEASPVPLAGGMLADATWPEVGALAGGVAVVLPVGSLEQHGPHLPLDTDTRVACALAASLAARKRWWLAPPVCYGSSGEHAGFPGTISVGSEVLTRVVVEIVRSARAMCRGTVVVSAHGGNAGALADASAIAGADGDHMLVLHASVPDADAHAGRTETSMMLALAPETVRMAQAEAGRTEHIATLMGALRRGGVASVSGNGVLGDPAGASPEEGRQVLQQLTDRLDAQAGVWWQGIAS